MASTTVVPHHSHRAKDVTKRALMGLARFRFAPELGPARLLVRGRGSWSWIGAWLLMSGFLHATGWNSPQKHVTRCAPVRLRHPVQQHDMVRTHPRCQRMNRSRASHPLNPIMPETGETISIAIMPEKIEMSSVFRKSWEACAITPPCVFSPAPRCFPPARRN